MSRPSLLRLVTDNAPLQAEPILASLLELLSLARGAYGGDLDKFLIMMVVSIRAAGHKDFATALLRHRATGATPVFPSLGVNIQSIADSIGAPKETIRRKVTDLVELGWIERRGNELFLTPSAYETLTPVREAMHLLVVRHHQIVEDLIEAVSAAEKKA
ncbi:MAG: hypothetical protein JWP50_3226 [Phenylobacterium sp.]|nr:hypothetical protein [Phenylobacterium sp.]